MRPTLVAFLWILASVLGPAGAQEVVEAAPDLVEAPRAWPVVLDGRALFAVTDVPDAGVTAEQRAALIAARLTEVAQDRGLLRSEVRSVVENDAVSFFVGDRLILIARASDAAHQGLTLERFGELLPPILEAAIRGYRLERSAPRMLRAVAVAAAVLLGAGTIMILYVRLFRRLRRWVLDRAARHLARAEATLATSAGLGRLRSALALVMSTANALVWLTALSVVVEVCLSLFPQTRAFSEQMLALATAPLVQTGHAIVASIPSLIFVAVVVVLTRVLLQLNAAVFERIEHGVLVIEGFYAEWARPTRRILGIALVVAGVVVAFPYIPGSDTAAFKSISILLGVIVSLGSSSVVSNFLNGLLLTYMRAFRVGDVVRIGDTLGTVVQSGTMVTRLRTLRETEMVIPNMAIMSGQVTNYSTAGMPLVATAVTIGYGTPWRQVHAMLELAAARTEGIRRDPAPFVLQSGLEDFYIRYELWVALEDPWRLPLVMASLHANIQDLFNEHGVQIMSPHYVLDPAEPAVVPRERWNLPPANL